MYRLLILEDDETERDAYKDFYAREIKTGEYELVFAETGEEALNILEESKNQKIDLIITDLRIPHAQIDGWKFIRTLAKKNIDIKIIVTTVIGSFDDFTFEQKRNIVHFLQKNTPETDPSALKVLVKQALILPDRITSNSQLPGLNTLAKLMNEVSSKDKLQMIFKLMSNLRIKELNQLESQFPESIKKIRKEAYQKDRVRQWLIEKEKTGEFKLPVPIESIEKFNVFARRDSSGVYCYVRWWQDGKINTEYVPKAFSDQLLLLLPPEKQKEKRKINKEF